MSRIPSPARSQGAPETPKHPKPRGSRSVCSPARSNASLKLSSVVEQFKENNMESFAMSPLGKSMLSDNTDIDMPKRKSWWKKVDHSRDILEVLDNHQPLATNNVMEEFDVEILSQEKKNYTLDMPESSDSESISSIVIPQRKLFTQKENLHQKVFGQVFGAGTRETLSQQNKTNIADKTANVGPKNLFNHGPKRSKPVFPAALLNISPDKTVTNKTTEMAAELKAPSRHLFGNRPGTKRKNIFADFVVSESEDDISEVQPKMFAFALNKNPVRHSRSMSRGIREPSPTSSITATDIEMDDWNMLPSSTMVEQQLEAAMPASTPGKRSRLSKLSEALVSVNTNSTAVQEVINRQGIEAEVRDNVETNQKIIKTADINDKAKDDVATEGFYNENQEQVIEQDNKECEDNRFEQNENEMVVPEYKVHDESLGQPGKRTRLSKPSEELISSEEAKKHHEEIEAEIEKNIKASQQETEASINGKAESDLALESNHEENQEREVIQGNRYNELEQQKKHSMEISQNKSKAIEFEDEYQEIEGDQNESKKEEDEEQNKNEDNEDEESEIEENKDKEQNGNEDNEDEEESEIEENEDKDQNEIEENEYEEQNKTEENENEEQNEIEENEREEHNESQVEEIYQGEEQVQNESIEVEEQEDVEDQNEHQEMQSHEEVNESEVIDNQEDEESEENEKEQNESQEVEERSASDDEVHNESQELEKQQAEEYESENEIEQSDIIDDSEEAQIEDTQDDQKLVYEDDNEEQNDEVKNDKDQIKNESGSPNMSHDTTDRNRKKQSNTASPEAILHNISNEMDTFTAKGRNTSIRKTKSILKNFTIRPSLAPLKDSTGFSDGTKNSSAEGSGWDSHRTTRRTLRQTFGKDFTPRKSLRALVMEKSAKRQTLIDAANANLHQANSTELPVDESNHQDMQVDEDQIDYEENAQEIEESDHEVSRRTRQTTLEMYLQKIKKNNMERKLKIEEEVRNSFKTDPLKDIMNIRVPSKLRRPNAKPFKSLVTAPKVKRIRSNLISLEDLPPELIEDMKYKPPKRFRPSNASWITNRLYKFLESKLETRYDYKARVRAEALVQVIYNFVRDTRRDRIAPSHMVNELKKEMARLDIVKTHADFYNFFHEYLPKEVTLKVIPDILNDIPLPKDGVFSDIIVS